MRGLAQQLIKTEDHLWPGWPRPRGPWLLGSQQPFRARDVCRRRLGRLDRDLRSERQLESEISRTEAPIATPLAISLNSSMLDSGRIVTPVA